jgi:predicted MPP superfamily phosphohydrolase
VLRAVVFGATFMGLLHAYVWWRLVRRAQLPRSIRIALTALMVLMWLLIPVTTTSRLWAPSLGATLGWITMPWMALIGLCFVTSVALHVITTVTRATTKRDIDLSRRRFLAGATAGVAGVSVARGITEARGTHEVVDVEVKLSRLPKALDGFTIVQLSDLHIGLTIDRAFVQRVVDLTNGLSPDVIALTGDLVDGPVADLADDVAPLANLRAKHGVFAITGNHEYYAGADAWIAHISSLGARYLRNELVTIADGFHLAGVDDYGASGWAGHGENLTAATANRDPAKPLVLLAHQPRQVRRAAKFGVDLQLSGHTHGGQIWPWHYIVKAQQGGLLAGRYEHGATQLYVTRGCGYWGPPVRLLAPLEITRVILRSA